MKLPNLIDSWLNVKLHYESFEYNSPSKEKAKWSSVYGDRDVTKEEIQTEWHIAQKNHTELTNEEIASIQSRNSIDCDYGLIDVYPNTLLLSMYVSYRVLANAYTAKHFLTLNRLIAENLNQTEVLYFPDNGYKTSAIWEEVYSCKSYSQVKHYAFNEFGITPRDIENGRKNMFFIDYMDEEINLTEWD